MAQPQRYDEFLKLASRFAEWADMKHYQNLPADKIVAKVAKAIQSSTRQLLKMSPPKSLLKKEPNTLAGIRKVRPVGPRRLWDEIPVAEYRKKLAGAWLGRCAGCTLGASVEFFSTDKMQKLAEFCGVKYPLTDYWPMAWEPFALRYRKDIVDAYTKPKMKYAPVDDDLTYTLLDLFILEDHGPDFTTRDVGKAWVKYLPMACTAEKVALDNLRAGVAAEKAATVNNPWIEWIGGDIRADGWGYMAPGWPEKAAELAFRESYVSHRFSGIYGTMFVAAAISAAMATGDVEEALEIALTEIPRDCRTARAVKWAMSQKGKVRNWKQARDAVDRKFSVSDVHTDNNLALSIFGLVIGKEDFTKVIGETVAMGMDNDCTAATAASIFGAAYGIDAIPTHWIKPFNNKIRTYMNGREWLKLSDTLKRFEAGARKVFALE